MSLEGRRFEVPSRYRHLERVAVRYARWDLRRVHLVDARSETVLCRLFPQDKARNADGLRRSREPTPDGVLPEARPSGMAPLLRQYVADYAASGLPPAYLAHRDRRDDDTDETTDESDDETEEHPA